MSTEVTPIPKTRTEKRQPRWKDDAPWRKAYLAEHPVCIIGLLLCGAAARHPYRWPVVGTYAYRCTQTATELHERCKRSQRGSTTDAANIYPTCASCHRFTEEQVAVSLELGLLLHEWE